MTDLTTYANRCNQAAATAREALSGLALALRDSAAAACLERAAVQEIKDGLPALEAPTDPSGPLAAALARAHQELDLAHRELNRQSVALVQLEEALIDFADEVDSAAACLPRPLPPVPAHQQPEEPAPLPDSATSSPAPFPFPFDLAEVLAPIPEVDRRTYTVTPDPNSPTGFSQVRDTEKPSQETEEAVQTVANPPEEGVGPPPAIQAVLDVEALLGVETPGPKPRARGRGRGRKKGS